MTNAPALKRTSTIVLQVIVVLIGIGALFLMLWEPQLEGRNAHATQFEIYFRDPFLAYVYLASIAFFAALFQAFRLFGYLGRDEASSPAAIRAVRIIKRCAIALVVMITAAVGFIAVRGSDDIAGGVAIGMFLILIFVTTGTAAAMFERRLQTAGMK